MTCWKSLSGPSTHTAAPRIAGASQSLLEILRFQFRLAKDLQCLKVDSYGFAAKAIDEIGNLVGGWLKSGGKP